MDILVAVRDIEHIDDLNKPMIERGYVPKAEFGIGRRRFSAKADEVHWTHHVHVYEAGYSRVGQCPNLRDYMRVYPAEEEACGQLKVELAQRCPHDIEGHMACRDARIKAANEEVRAWKESLSSLWSYVWKGRPNHRDVVPLAIAG